MQVASHQDRKGSVETLPIVISFTNAPPSIIIFGLSIEYSGLGEQWMPMYKLECLPGNRQAQEKIFISRVQDKPRWRKMNENQNSALRK